VKPNDLGAVESCRALLEEVEMVDRGAYVDPIDNTLIRMIVPFIVGLVVGYGANGLVERMQNHGHNAQASQSAPMNN